MKRAEETIEAVLAGLRDAEAPIGMERRIVDAVRDGAGARSGWGLTRWGGMRWGAWCAGLGVVAVGCVVVPMVHWAGGGHRDGQVETRRKLPAVAAGSTASGPALEGVVRPVRVTPLRANGGLKARARGAERDGDSDSLAVREMRAASRPAPELPLTEEEKLLLRVVQRGDPEELAALDPVVRAARDMEEKAEFQKFFGSSTAGQTLGQATTGENE